MPKHSPHPGTPQTATKAVVGAVIGSVGVGVMWYFTGEFNQEEAIGFVSVLLSALGVLQTRNKPA